MKRVTYYKGNFMVAVDRSTNVINLFTKKECSILSLFIFQNINYDDDISDEETIFSFAERRHSWVV